MSSEELYKGHGWRLTLDTAKLPDGRTAQRARAHYADIVHLLAVNSEKKLVILKEYRPFYGIHMWMLPSGHVDKETDTDAAAQRELREETGFRAEKLKHLWTARASEGFTGKHLFYLAEGLTKDPLPQDADELIEVHALDPKEAYERIISSKEVSLPSAYGVLRYLREASK